LRFKGVVCFSAIDWNFLKQRVHYITGELAEKGLKVLFIENTGVRSPGLKDLRRILTRLGNARDNSTDKNIPGNIELFSPLAVPFPYNHPAVIYNVRYCKRRINAFLKAHSLKPPEVLFFTYLATPVVLNLAELYPWGGLVYDLVSDPKLVEARIEKYEKRLLLKADTVLFASHTLYQQYRDYTKNPVVFEDGFNTELLKAELKPCPVDSLPRPRFLYIGGINRKIWPEMIGELAREYPGGSVVLVGPRDDDVKIPDLSNIHILPGLTNYSDLASYLDKADAGIIPYYNDRYSGVMHPAKLNEYLIFGLPVVATTTPELEALDAKWGRGFLSLGKDPGEFAGAAGRALKCNSDQTMKARMVFTQQNTWSDRLEELFNILKV